MNTVADEVWVPSQYNADTFRSDGVRKRQIQVSMLSLRLSEMLTAPGALVLHKHGLRLASGTASYICEQSPYRACTPTWI